MDFKLRVDSGALVNLADVKGNSAGIEVTDADLLVNLGTEFNAQLSRSAIAQAEPISDPRPTVYFPMGLSAAAEKLGRDTVCVVTSYDGLVKVDFNQEVQGEGRPARVRSHSGTGHVAGEYQPPTPLGTWARFIIVIVALVLIAEAISTGHFLWVLIAVAVLVVLAILRTVYTSLRERSAKRSAPVADRTPIPFRHIIVSVEDPQGLVKALNERGGSIARPAS